METYTWAASFLCIQCCLQAPCPNEVRGRAETRNHKGGNMDGRIREPCFSQKEMPHAAACNNCLAAFIKINKHPTERKVQKALNVSCLVKKMFSLMGMQCLFNSVLEDKYKWMLSFYASGWERAQRSLLRWLVLVWKWWVPCFSRNSLLCSPLLCTWKLPTDFQGKFDCSGMWDWAPEWQSHTENSTMCKNLTLRWS